MSQASSFKTLIYKEEDIDDIDNEPENPINIEINFAVACKCTPSKFEVAIADRNSIPPQIVSFETADFISVETLYEAIHQKVRAAPESNKFFMFSTNKDWNGFICTDNHTHFIANNPSSILIVTLNDTFVQRITNHYNKSTLNAKMTALMDPENAPVNVVGEIISERKRKTYEHRTQILANANSDEYNDRNPSIRIESLRSSLIVGPNEDITLIPIWSQYKPLFLGLNSACYAIEMHLLPRKRVYPLDEEMVREIVLEVIRKHAMEETEEEEEQNETEESSN